MTELRVILLIAGLLFIAGIAGFEWWRARRNRPTATVAREEAPKSESASAPRASLPDIQMSREPRTAVPEDLPVIELASTSASGTRRALGISISDDVATDTLGDMAREAPAEPVQSAPPAKSAPPVPPAPTTQPTPPTPPTPPAPSARPPSAPRADFARNEPYIGQDDEVSQVRIIEEQPPMRGPQLVLAWPKESERRIVTLRVIPRSEPRFSGRSLRQAFASAGFWHGPFDIYHLPDEAGRVVVSAAALAQPGTFDPSIMDSQRFSGLNLFAVLPGPMDERDAFDALVGAARTLAERLEGSITDQYGEELTSGRIQRLRQALPEPMQARAAGEA
jgi:cell division protein ZipA